MEKPKHHIFVCSSFRASGEIKGMCNKKGSTDLLPYIETEILDRGIDALLTSTGCMKQCDNGPIMVIQPENWWFKGVNSEEVIDTILDGLEDGEPAAEYLIL